MVHHKKTKVCLQDEVNKSDRVALVLSYTAVDVVDTVSSDVNPEMNI